MRTWQEIKDERDHAVEVGRNASNCLGNLYNILRNAEENGPDKTAQRRDECLSVLESELATMQRDRREVVEAINARINELKK